MKRTIIGLFDGEAPDSIESKHDGDDVSVQVDEVQQNLSGRPVYHGTAAKRVEREEDVVTIDPETGDIDEDEDDVERVISTEWVAFLDAGPPFVAVDSSEGTFLFDEFGGGIICRRGAYSVDVSAERIRTDHDASFWGVNWSEGENGESGSYYPGVGEDDNEILERAMSREKPQVGFSYFDGEDVYRGVIAESGYLALFRPEDLEFPGLVAWLRNEALTDAYIPRGDG